MAQRDDDDDEMPELISREEDYAFWAQWTHGQMTAADVRDFLKQIDAAAKKERTQSTATRRGDDEMPALVDSDGGEAEAEEVDSMSLPD